VLPLLKTDHFVEVFESKGRFSHLLADVPIHVVLHRTALMGAARYALDVMQHEVQTPAGHAGAAMQTGSARS